MTQDEAKGKAKPIAKLLSECEHPEMVIEALQFYLKDEPWGINIYWKEVHSALHARRDAGTDGVVRTSPPPES